MKSEEPRIDWYVSDRKPEQVTEYLPKAAFVAHEIAAGHFYKRPGKWCGDCDCLPVCLGDEATVRETLVQVALHP